MVMARNNTVAKKKKKKTQFGFNGDDHPIWKYPLANRIGRCHCDKSHPEKLAKINQVVEEQEKTFYNMDIIDCHSNPCYSNINLIYRYLWIYFSFYDSLWI